MNWVWQKIVQGWDDSLLKMHVVKVGCHLIELHRNSQSRHCNLDGDTVNPGRWGCLRHPDRAGNRYWDSQALCGWEQLCVFLFFLSPVTPLHLSLHVVYLKNCVFSIYVCVYMSREGLAFAFKCIQRVCVCVCVSTLVGPSGLQTSAPVMREFGSITQPHPGTRRTSVLAYAL